MDMRHAKKRMQVSLPTTPACLVDLRICAYLHISGEFNFFLSTSFISGCFNIVSNYRNGISREKKKF